MSFGGGKSRSAGGGGGGWAAFDREQRRKRQGVVENSVVKEGDPFPALPSKSKSKSNSNSNSNSKSKSKSNSNSNSKWKPSMTSIANNGGRFCLSDGDRGSSSYSWRGGPTPTQIQRLKELHHNWRAQQQQDQDFMAFSTSISMPIDQNHNNDQNEKQLHFGSTSSCSSSTNKEKSSHFDCGTNDDDFDAEIPLNLMMNLNLNKISVPVEPEWEDEYEYEYDDVYLRQRKQAFKTIRSASQHSKAATNAFLRGDHVSAHQHSLKAHHQWLTAETLNAKAAKDILSIRNAHNDVWKLDLHGLHANEAVQVLHQHLHNIETKPSCKRSVSPNSLNMETRIRRSNSLESFGSVEDQQQQAFLKQRPTSLQVITGVGNHSRGQASLPAAVKGFLSENGYRFEELKPGVISVRPKFRLLS